VSRDPLDDVTVDLFGRVPEAQVINSRVKKGVQPNGYAGIPGTGPAGMTCKDCRHYTLKQMAKAYRKCGHHDARIRWTGGTGTDILARSPACSKFEL
jgi:hypothetical protein